MALRNEKLIFTAVVTSVAGTEYYVPATYQWDFGTGDIRTSAESSITYSYSVSGSWNITLTVTNNVSSTMFVGRVDVSKGQFLACYSMYRICDCNESRMIYNIQGIFMAISFVLLSFIEVVEYNNYNYKFQGLIFVDFVVFEAPMKFYP